MNRRDEEIAGNAHRKREEKMWNWFLRRLSVRLYDLDQPGAMEMARAADNESEWEKEKRDTTKIRRRTKSVEMELFGFVGSTQESGYTVSIDYHKSHVYSYTYSDFMYRL